MNGNRIVPPFPAGTKLALFGLGCFWGAGKSLAAYQERLTKAGHGKITTEILDAPEFYYADDSDSSARVWSACSARPISSPYPSSRQL